MAKAQLSETATLDAGRIERRTIQAQVYAQLREAIMRGRYAPGQELSIREVAAALETSTMPVRDAFTRLSVEGAIEIQTNRRPRLPVLSPARLDEITRLRVELEGMASELAAATITPASLAELDAICQETQAASQAARIDDYLAGNWRFHRAIYVASGSELLLEIIETLWLRVGPSIRLCAPNSGHFAHSICCHRRALAALKAGDGAEARAAIVLDIDEAAKDIALRLAEPSGPAA